MSSRPRRIIAFLTVVALILVGACWRYRAEEITWAWYRAIAARPLSAAESRALVACRDPGWWGWVRVLEQDVDVACPPEWVAQGIAADLVEQRRLWLERLARHPGRPARERRRILLALRAAHQPLPPGLALLLSEPDVPSSERAWVASTLADDERWADPSLRALIVEKRFLDGDVESYPQVADALRLGPTSGGDQLPLLRQALERTDLAHLERWRRRTELGLGVGDAPIEVLRRFSQDPAWCARLDQPVCVDAIADRLVLAAEPEGGAAGVGVDDAPEAAVPAVFARPLWDALYDGQTADAASRELTRYAEWIRDAEGDEAARRLIGLVAHRRHGFSVAQARQGEVGDPLWALRRRRSAPFTTALAAVSLGQLAGIDVQIYPIGDGVVVQVGGLQAAIAECGGTFPVPSPLVAEAWPARAVLAQASVEAAGAALRARDLARARRLARLAERSDPVSAAGVSVVVEAAATRIGSEIPGPHGVTPTTEAVATSLARLGAVGDPGDAPTGGERERRFRAILLEHALAEWNEPVEDGRCPSSLGP
jgi:hypothetical protein